ncbi:MAG: hypothetical protein JJU20_09370 [Opitutales bacterium]|nr:hypothetical protein [Opitutales bacterium]
MPFFLVFVFLMMSGIAFVFAWFFAEVVFRDSPDRSLQRFRNGLALFTLVFPNVSFGLYYASLPEGESWVTAFYPALWIFMVLGAIVLGVTVALFRRNG